MSWHIIDVMASAVMLVWSYTALVGYLCFKMFGKEIPRLLKHIFFELRPFVLPAMTFDIFYEIFTEEHLDFWFYLTSALNYFAYFYWKDKFGDDDRWKKRLEKSAEVVKQVGSKLVVIPNEA